MLKTILLVALCGVAGAKPTDHLSGPVKIQFDSDRWEVAPQKGAFDAQRAPGVLASVQERESFEKFNTRFSIVAEDTAKFRLDEAGGVDRYRHYALDFLSGQRFQIISKKEVQLAGISALQITAHQRDFGLTYRQWVVVIGQRAYLLTGAARIKRFDLVEKDLNAIAESFRLSQAG